MSNNYPAKGTEENKYQIVMKLFDKSAEVSKIEKEPTKQIDELSKKWDMNDKILELFISNIEKDQKLKEKYAIILIIVLAIQLVALIVIFILKGCEVLKYSDSTFNLFITGGIAEVFVLVRLIVKYLFKDNLTNALNIILKNNNYIKNMNHKKNEKTSDKR